MVIVKFIIIFLLIGCNIEPTLTPPVIETICKEANTLYSIESNKVCGNSMSCMTGVNGTLNKYFCVCDNLCLCFYAYSKTNKDCIDIKEIGCKFNSFFVIADGNFCSISKNKRDNFLSKIKISIQNYEQENVNEVGL